MEWFAPLAFGYLMGSVPFGLILTRLTGAGDLRSIGSGNIGATNVLRTGRKGLAAATLLLDAGKGALAVLMAAYWSDGDPIVVALTGLFALLGHCFPLWLKFRGGKGVATMLGVSLALDWRIGVAAAAVWLLVAVLTRISSLGGIGAAVAAPLAAFALSYGIAPALLGLGEPIEMLIYGLGLAAMALIVVWQHRANIARLLAGTEPRIGQKG